jgi:hypothetical protein
MKYQLRELSYIILLLILSIMATLILKRIPTEEPKQEPPFAYVLEFDIADHCGEEGCIYVVRAEWIYLSKESAEAKRQEMKVAGE